MKKLLIGLMILPVYGHAYQYFSFLGCKFYTLPHVESIDQDKYHEEACLVNIIMREMINAGISHTERMKLVHKYLTEKNTPECIRLWSDIYEIMQ